jgi:hypothetical protein
MRIIYCELNHNSVFVWLSSWSLIGIFKGEAFACTLYRAEAPAATCFAYRIFEDV